MPPASPPSSHLTAPPPPGYNESNLPAGIRALNTALQTIEAAHMNDVHGTVIPAVATAADPARPGISALRRRPYILSIARDDASIDRIYADALEKIPALKRVIDGDMDDAARDALALQYSKSLTRLYSMPLTFRNTAALERLMILRRDALGAGLVMQALLETPAPEPMKIHKTAAKQRAGAAQTLVLPETEIAHILNAPITQSP